MVPPIRLLKIWQDIALMVYSNHWWVKHVNKRRGVRSMEYTCDGSRGLIIQISGKKLWRKRKRIGSLASHLGILDDDFEELLDSGKLSKFRSWYKKLGLRVQTLRDHSITWIDFDKALTIFQWSHLLRHQIICQNTRPDWVYRPTCGWVEILGREKIRLDARYWSRDILIKRLVERSAAEEVFKNGGLCKNISGWTTVGGMVEHTIGKRVL